MTQIQTRSPAPPATAEGAPAGADTHAVLVLLEDVSRRFSITSLGARVSEIRESATENDHVDIVVLGRFKSGKSSLLNALLGRDVLPIDVLPSTAVVTRVAAGTRDRAHVVGENGTAADIDLGEIRRYVTERENPDNVKRVARVDVELSKSRIPAGLRLVDTPGVGSLHRHNTDVAERWLPRVGAALVAISADQPLSEQDVALLEELRSFTPFATIVLTKVDLLEPDQIRAVEEYIAQQTTARLGRAVAVAPVSTRHGHQGTIAGLRQFLADTIADHRTQAADAILTHKVRATVDGCREYLRVALEAARAGAQVRETLRAEIEEERRNLGLIRRELTLLSGDLREQAFNETERHFLAHRTEITRDLLAELTRQAPVWRGHLAHEADGYRDWLTAAIESRLAEASAGEQGAFQDIVDQAEVAIDRAVRAFKDRRSERVRQALGISFAGAAFEARPEVPKKPSLHLGRVFDTNIDLLWFLIPMVIFRPLVHRHFRRGIAWEVEKHLYRLSAQWTEALGSAIEGSVSAARGHLRAELATLTDMLSHSTDESREVQQALDALDAASLTRALGKTTGAAKIEDWRVSARLCVRQK